MKEQFIQGAKACLANGDRLLFDVEMLSTESPTSLALAVIAEEEFAKGFLLYLVGIEIMPWNLAIWRASRDHKCKHLLAILMDYADPDIDQMLTASRKSQSRHEKIMRIYDNLRESLRQGLPDTVSEWRSLEEQRHRMWNEIRELEEEQASADRFPAHVADAINIFRNERIAAFESSGWYRTGEKYDPTAQSIADGARDREKQEALYLGLSKGGQVCSRPEKIAEDAVRRALERAKKIRSFLSGTLDYGRAGAEFERLVAALKMMFAE